MRATLLVVVFLLSVPRQSRDISDHAESRVLNRALGVECTHCHTEGSWRDAGKRPFGTARNMMVMVEEINRTLRPREGISCVTCHGGQRRPARQPRELLDQQLAQWPQELASAPEAQKITMAVYNIALGVTCDHCHSTDWKARDKPAMKTVQIMTSLFQIFPKHMPTGARTQCYMCHKGSTKPLRVVTSRGLGADSDGAVVRDDRR